MKNFFRKVAFGLKPDEKEPSDPLVWAQKQVETIPEFSWKGKRIPTEKEMRKYWIKQRVEENGRLRKEFKDDPVGFRKAEVKLGQETGRKFWPANEISIRHAEGIRSTHPVLAKLWYFWTNHFTISDTQSLAEFSTGAYHRDFIRANMDKNFETMATQATLAWPMIMHLDNKENIGPKSESGREDWRRRKKEPATLNENHARELMELHTISPDGGYNQEDVIELAKIMTGWRPKWTKKKDNGNDVSFISKYHEPGKKIVLGKEKEFENVWKNRDTHLKDVPGFKEFHLVKGETNDEHTLYASHSIWNSKNDFVNIILKYCEKFKLPFNDKTEKEAIKWSLQRGNRTGRSAWQFIINYAAENNKKIDI